MKPFVVAFVALVVIAFRPAVIQASTIMQYDVNLSAPAQPSFPGVTLLATGTINFDLTTGDIASSDIYLSMPGLLSPFLLFDADNMTTLPREVGLGTAWQWLATPTELIFEPINPSLGGYLEWTTLPGLMGDLSFESGSGSFPARIKIEDLINNVAYNPAVGVLSPLDNTTSYLVGTAVPEPSAFVIASVMAVLAGGFVNFRKRFKKSAV